MTLVDRLTDAINSAGINAFSLSMPVLSNRWNSDASIPGVDDAAFSLNLTTGNWLAPIAGSFIKIDPSDSEGNFPLPVTLIRPNGQAVNERGKLLTVFPQTYLRLRRLYQELFEQAPSAGSNLLIERARQLGIPVRPLPRYFFYAVTGALDETAGNADAGDSLGISGEMTIYDSNGLPIDPISVIAAFNAIQIAHPILLKESGSGSDNTLSAMVNSLPDTPVVRLWLSKPDGSPYNGEHLTGLNPAPPVSSGVFQLASDSARSVGLATADETDFPEEERRLFLVGPTTTGKLGDNFTLPALPSGLTLKREFFSLHIVQLGQYLLGESTYPDAADTADEDRIEQRPKIRTNEPLSLLADGNDVLAGATAAIPAGSDESLAVAQTINGNFRAPGEIGANAHWPNFPPTTAEPDDNDRLEINLRENFQPEARLFDNGDPDRANLDVVLSLQGLPPNAAVRAYTRKFTEDAIEQRHDGAGGVVNESGEISLLLKDPLSIRRPGDDESTLSLPAEAILHVDLIVVRRNTNRVSRIYGNLETPILLDSSVTTDPTPAPGNRFDAAARKGISHAGVLGLKAEATPLSLETVLKDAILNLTGEGEQRDAPRFPTMARRELLVAGLSGGSWNSVISGGRLTPETHSAEARLGSPGGLGGRETQVTGAQTQGGQLAYDIARMAFRRTHGIIDRLEGLADTNWNEPAALSAGGSDAGTFAGAVLQTIARYCETPALSLLEDTDILDNLPDTFAALVDLIKDEIDGAVPQGTPSRPALLTELKNRLDSLLADIGITPANQERLYNELKREIVSSIHGRRDAQWALAGAIDQARRFIYIESPGFTATQKNYAAGEEPEDKYFVDLINKIKTRLVANPGLHVIICTPRVPDYGPGYEPFALQEAVLRKEALTDTGLPQRRVVAYHPIGFPGRPSRLESTVVIIDDVWAMVGSSAFRRRGLTFDGGADLVLTDTERIDGISPAISRFRMQLQANRLGLQLPPAAIPDASADDITGTVRDANLVRLGDGVESFYMIREMLRVGGLGKISRFWRPPDPETTLGVDIVNPEPREFVLEELLTSAVLASLHSRF